MTVQPYQILGGGPRGATGHVRIATNPNDTDTLTITVGGVATIYEFDNNAAVTSGRVSVAIGGSAVITAATLLAAILANQPLLFAGLGPITTLAGALQCVDLKANSPVSGAITLAESSGGRIVVQDNAGESVGPRVAMRGIRRVVTAEDVLRALIVLDFGFDTINAYSLDIWTAEPGSGIAVDATRIAYVGAVGVVTNNGIARLCLDNSGGVDFAAGHVIYATATGHLPATSVGQ